MGETVVAGGPTSRFNPDSSPLINALSADADAYYRSSKHRYSSFDEWAT